MGNEEIHPDLRRVAPFVPRQAVYPWSLPLLKRDAPPAPGKQRRRRDPDASIRCRGPALPACEHQSQHPALLWIHGGGYVIGSPEQDDVLCRPLCREARHHGGGRALPAGTGASLPRRPREDCYRAPPGSPACPAWTCTESRSAGASAGGGRPRPSPSWPATAQQKSPGAATAPYPMLDDRSVDPSQDRAGFRLWNAASNRIGWTSYLRGADPAEAVPARRDDLARPARGVDRRRNAGSVPPRGPRLRRTAHRRRGAVPDVRGAGCVPRVRWLMPKTPVAQRYFDNKCGPRGALNWSGDRRCQPD